MPELIDGVDWKRTMSRSSACPNDGNDDDGDDDDGDDDNDAEEEEKEKVNKLASRRQSSQIVAEIHRRTTDQVKRNENENKTKPLNLLLCKTLNRRLT